LYINIYFHFNNNSINIKTGSDDLILMQIQNLERKINGKFEKQDEINIYNGDGLDQLQDQVEKNIKETNSNIDEIYFQIKDLRDSIKKNNDLFNNDFNDKLNKLKNYLDLKINE
jgi:hypothetical protein